MKKIKHVALALLVFCSFGVNAQLPDGSVAPDFTITDIEGVQHNLNTYLSQGKTVFLDFFNSLCSGCWLYHHSESMDKIYATYGHIGTNELVVLFVDGSIWGSVEHIRGYSEYSYGDWVADSKFPIIPNGSSIRDAYQVPGFPHLVKICPNGNGQGILSNVNLSQNPNTYFNYINSCSTPSSILNHGQLFDAKLSLCQTNIGTPTFKFRNVGTNTITTSVFKLYEDGVEVAEYNYIGNIGQWDDEEIPFSNVDFNFQSNYTAKVVSINGATPFNEGLVTCELHVEEVTLSTLNEVVVQVTTGRKGSRALWDLKEANGTMLSSGGPFNDFPIGTTPNFLHQPDVVVPLDANKCYEFNMRATDEFPWVGQFQIATEDSTVRRYILKNSDQSILYKAKKYPNFVNSETVYFHTYATAATQAENLSESDFILYPNPSKDMVRLTAVIDGCFEYTINDLSGRTILGKQTSCANENNSIEFNTADWSKGYYNVNIYIGGKLQVVKKMVKL
ncbi:MAG: T9SS type A sorting domain-containing protein [Lishizhenia sp.]